MKLEKLIYEMSAPGRSGIYLPEYPDLLEKYKTWIPERI